MIDMNGDDPATTPPTRIIFLVFMVLFLAQPVNAGVITGSGIASGYYEGYYTTFSFLDYCPLCTCYDVLIWNPKGTYEGEITCSYCDADYSVSGKDKYYRGDRAWLTPYTEPIETEAVPVVEKNQTKDLINMWKDYQALNII
jgi:hypothetical protein